MVKAIIIILMIPSFCFAWEPKIESEIGYVDLYHKIKTIYPGLSTKAMTDTVYRIPAFPACVLSNFPHKNLAYIKNKRDCEDFFYMFKSWLAIDGWGDLLVMSVKIHVPKKGMHILVGFLRHGKLLLGDPKLGKIVKYKNYKIERIII